MQIAVNNVETRFDAEQVFLNEIDSNNTPKNIKEVCEGTRIEETSISGNCPGLILNNYKRLPQNPRCFACRTLRDRLFTKAARQRTAANKKYKSQIPLKRLKNKCNLLQKKTKKLRSIVKTIKDKYTQISDKSFQRRIQSLDESERLVVTTFFEMAKKSNSKGRRYKLEWIYECLLIRFKSSSLYEMLRKRKILPLPTKSTLDKYIRRLNSSAYGFQPVLFECMKKRGENMPLSDRRGELVIDEMQLASGVSFNTNTKDFIGLVNLCDHTPDNLKNTVRDHALVFQFVPFKGGKSQALACFISKNAVTSQILQKLILECIILLSNAGFHVDAVTSDGAQWNRAVWKIFGIDEKKLSCPHPCDEKKSYG
ncbi:uncharacterized protein LOC130451506 isoform X1 [Diorhabda sublineata]|uniref:uncharacterized protein LOC130451506 isoform X1 n=1 Tax=Diorhabda sublineata TaxID=1163346 RepID=UPI0024E07F46|nr:uncharacterized protein LOC130451506 isoform X1 [Diorhabda sublineata]XP_056646530.1 uncharacterized protein LOC130451506 isoform X1 [Diorhabda sublineata]XP_056646531.1 uncharacterized protein LOC130451506 isoform X1 [Diorhabda sublineata]XP_056646532.1 uncharacterized protein LOC130451506 isoform X1 [Diorhabda sublineata]XP_056646533.1 uncharacterized protein LOC130451506 isoform X1 [Diorhabda sublineata]XP_056646534.1 uncharacterized protein LOC130451506 isoform X1 [Diorhabda sublineata]